MTLIIAERRAPACISLPRDVHASLYQEGITPSTLHAIEQKRVTLAKRMALFPLCDFAMPETQGRDHPLPVEENDGHGRYLAIALSGKEAAPHDHGISCVNASVSGRGRQVFYRRTDSGTEAGRARPRSDLDVMWLGRGRR